MIYRSPKEIIREVKLRRGLNIIWSRDHLPATTGAASQTGLGHSAGKTLFCRLLRYALGEEAFGDADLEREVRRLVPAGWVGADVEVAGVSWAVLRPLRPRGASRARQGSTLDALFSEPDDKETYGTFLHALERSLPRLPKEVEGGIGALRWPASLAWLSRDQERHFRELRDWRTRWVPARTEPTLTWLSNFMRASLQLRADDEEVAFQAKAGRLRQRKDVRRKASALRDVETFARSIGIFKGTDDGLLFRMASQSAVQPVEATHAPFDVSDLIMTSAALEAAKTKLAELERREEEARQQHDVALRELSRFQAARATMIDRLARETECPKCQYRWDRLATEGSPFVLPGVRPVREEDKLRELEEFEMSAMLRLDRASEEIKALGFTRVETKRELERCAQKHDEARRRFASRSKDILNLHGARAVAENDQHRFLELVRQGATLQEQNRELGKSIDDLKEELDAARNRQGRALTRVDLVFGAVVRELFDENAIGAVRLKKQNLECDIYLDGRRRSAALDALNVIAFDVTVMALAGEGQAALPAWLVHDSPRTADLAVANYRRLFELIARMENATADEPWFQYIITTTTSPPAEFQGRDYVKLELSGANSAERLLMTTETGKAA